MIAFWVTAPCSLGDRPYDESSAHLWNGGLLQQNYTKLYSRRLSSSYSPPWETETSHTSVTC